jgi:hypothetical protein
MKNITAKEHFGYAVTIRRLFEGCTNEFGEPCFTNKETGEIRCFGGKLNPRPSYQREFVYSEQDQKKVFETLHRAFPLGTMYWCDTGDGSYELIDGQQRTISILNILTDGVSISMYGEDKFFSDLPESEQEQILDQELLVYVCSGDVSEKLDWFSTINIAGKALKAQELRSAVYSGPFVSDARRYFVSNAEGAALANGYDVFVNNSTLRQELLEQVLFWHADFEGFNDGNLDKAIRNYLKAHRSDINASALFSYYEEVLGWANYIFGTKYKKELPKVEWGLLYNRYHEIPCSPREIRAKVDALMENPEITKKAAVFEYVFSGEEKILSPRAFDDSMKRSKLEEQDHKCAYCGGEIPDMKSAHADHIIPWSKGGKTEYGNLQILCVKCNCKKSAEQEAANAREFSIKQ